MKNNKEYESIESIIIDKLNEMTDGSIDINSETSLDNDLGMDSLDFVEFIMELEKEFDIQILDDPFANKSNIKIKDLVEVIELIKTKS